MHDEIVISLPSNRNSLGFDDSLLQLLSALSLCPQIYMLGQEHLLSLENLDFLYHRNWE